MWLLNVHSRQLECFEGNRIPAYAILSHRWEDEEVTFQELRDGHGKSKKGYRKIDLCCTQAAQQQKWHNRYTNKEGNDLSYAWIDTCCIDKTNSAELSEAINSMYLWYRQAAVCYAYLSDVKSAEARDDFENTAWFTRGWTLQELLAPSTVHFYNLDWVKLGERKDLANSISKVTRIATKVINSFEPWTQACAADIMSWAARRQTSREEDRAYSLLGLFDVNMPLIYGEGKRAFYRLQEEILKVSHDMTILAWTRAEPQLSTTSSIFADSPSWFNHGGSYVRQWRTRAGTESGLETLPGSSMTGKGLSVSLGLLPVYLNIFLAPLGYFAVASGNQKTMGMLLQRWDDGLFRRYHGDDYEGLFEVPEVAGSWGIQSSNIILARGALRGIPPSYRNKETAYGFNVDVTLLNGNCDIYSKVKPNQTVQLGIYPGSSGIAGMVRYYAQDLRPTFYVFGFNFDFSPLCLVVRPNRSHDQSWSPEKTSVSVWRLGVQDFVIGSVWDMLALLLALQARKDQAWSVENDGVELHVMPWKVKRTVFQVSTGEEIVLLATGALTYAKISPGGNQFGKPTSGMIDTWYHHPSR